jgi:hypothetical protein
VSVSTWREQERPVDDSELLARISSLADEEHQLERSHGAGGLGEDELQRLRSIEVALDQCWDLLRQRRARRHADADPDKAAARSEEVVENYEQ